MRATLEFNLPDEESDFRRAVEASKWYFVLMELFQHVRKRLKYEQLDEQTIAALEDVRGVLLGEMDDAGLTFDD
jgi:hypothetical protein